MREPNEDITRATLDFLILNTLKHESVSSFAIKQRIGRIASVFKIDLEFFLPTALTRLESRGWINSEWHEIEDSGRTKLYVLTHSGWEQLETEWNRRKSILAQFVEHGPNYRFKKVFPNTWN